MSVHIKSELETEIAWCGEKLKNEFYFKNCDTAVLNGMHGSELHPCVNCTKIIIDYLTRGLKE